MVVACIFAWINDMLAIGLSFVFVVFAFLTRHWKSPIGHIFSMSKTAAVRRRRYIAYDVLEVLYCYACDEAVSLLRGSCSSRVICVCLWCLGVCIDSDFVDFEQLIFEYSKTMIPINQPYNQASKTIQESQGPPEMLILWPLEHPGVVKAP